MSAVGSGRCCVDDDFHRLVHPWRDDRAAWASAHTREAGKTEISVGKWDAPIPVTPDGLRQAGSHGRAVRTAPAPICVHPRHHVVPEAAWIPSHRLPRHPFAPADLLCHGLEQLGQHHWLRHGTFHVDLFVEHRAWHSVHVVLAGQMGEFDRLDHVGPNVLGLDRELVGQANCLGAVRSGRSDKHLDMHRLRELGQLLLCLGL